MPDVSPYGPPDPWKKSDIPYALALLALAYVLARMYLAYEEEHHEEKMRAICALDGTPRAMCGRWLDKEGVSSGATTLPERSNR